MSDAPLKVWARALADDTRQQLEAMAREPYVFGHVAAMPDAHVAQGVAVGTVFATAGVIVPTALGGDLGCGVAGVRFDAAAGLLRRNVLEKIVRDLHSRIPVGDDAHRGGVDVPAELLATPLATHALDKQRQRLLPRQLGTLGGGNHFVELDRDQAGDVWLLVHSGSRGLGQAIAQHHLAATRVLGVGKLRGVSLEHEEARACLRDLEWACTFARANRDRMIAVASEILLDRLGITASAHVDTMHNFVAQEEHGGHTLLVHRKGAIAAPRDSLAIIPGSMGTATYVVRGLGAEAAWRSASHGAGRVMNRAKARAVIKPDALRRAMKDVVYDETRTRALVEEAPAVYRDIGEVMEDQRDLVEPLLRLQPVAVVKG